MVLFDHSPYPFIIAEAGVNHNGSLPLALRMVEEAAKAGADYIKFQTFKTENIVCLDTPAAKYQNENCGAVSQYEMLKKLELSFSDFETLKKHCNNFGIGFVSTPFDKESLHFLVELGMDFIKIPSGEITNLPLLREMAKSKLPIVASTGMSDINDIKKMVEVFKTAGYKNDEIILLHCNTQYPTPFKDVNLLAMNHLRKMFDINIGYSDHTEGIEVALAAAALGAKVIEKHFTLDNNMEGPDHLSSVIPSQLGEMIKGIRNITDALGSEQKIVTESEKENIKAARKSIIAAKNIKKDEIFTENNLTVKRPGTGISPMEWDSVIGQYATRDFEKDEIITK